MIAVFCGHYSTVTLNNKWAGTRLEEYEVRELRGSLGSYTSMLCFWCLVQLQRSINIFWLLSNEMKFSHRVRRASNNTVDYSVRSNKSNINQKKSWIVCNCLYGKSVAAVGTGVYARVYVLLLWWVWHALNRYLEHQCMSRCRCVCCDRCLLTPVYMFVSTLSAGCAHSLVYVQFVP